LFARDKMFTGCLADVLYGYGQRFPIARDNKARDLQDLAVTLVGLLDRIGRCALYRDHGVTQIALDRRLRAVYVYPCTYGRRRLRS